MPGAGLARFAGPGSWNDPDMLQVGNGQLTPGQERAHFALWALLKAPLLIGADLRKISATSLAVLKAREVVAVHQDDLGVAGENRAPLLSVWMWWGKGELPHGCIFAARPALPSLCQGAIQALHRRYTGGGCSLYVCSQCMRRGGGCVHPAGELVWKQGPREVYAAPLSGGGRAVVFFNRHLVQYRPTRITGERDGLGAGRFLFQNRWKKRRKPCVTPAAAIPAVLSHHTHMLP